MHLVRPTAEYRESFIAGVREFQKEGRNLRYDISELESDFEAFASELCEKENIPLSAAKVPETIYWLIDNNEFIGRISIRKYLNEYLESYGGNIGYEIRPSKRGNGYGNVILELGIEKAREMGMEKLLICCSSENIASRKIIKKNGGKFESWIHQDSSLILRYWIEI